MKPNFMTVARVWLAEHKIQLTKSAVDDLSLELSLAYDQGRKDTEAAVRAELDAVRVELGVETERRKEIFKDFVEAVDTIRAMRDAAPAPARRLSGVRRG